MKERQLKSMLEALEQDEEVELCDDLVMGRKPATEGAQRLAGADESVQTLRALCEPPSEAATERNVELILNQLSVVSLQERRKRSRSMLRWPVFAGVLAAAAALAVALWPRTARLPDYDLDRLVDLYATQHGDSMPLGPPAHPGVTSDAATPQRLRPDACVQMNLRPRTRLQHSSLSLPRSQAYLVKDSSKVVPWEIKLEPMGGALHNQGKCIPLPKNLESGSWQLVLFIGRSLPDADQALRVQGPSGRAPDGSWQYFQQPLDLQSSP